MGHMTRQTHLGRLRLSLDAVLRTTVFCVRAAAASGFDARTRLHMRLGLQPPATPPQLTSISSLSLELELLELELLDDFDLPIPREYRATATSAWGPTSALT